MRVELLLFGDRQVVAKDFAVISRQALITAGSASKAQNLFASLCTNVYLCIAGS